MKLYYASSSPYVKKVLACAIELGIDNAIELIPCNVPERDDELRQYNPLGKIPAMLTRSGSVLFDSPVICRWLAASARDPRLCPPDPAEMARAMTLEALGDGIVDACQIRRKELLRGEAHLRQDVVDHQRKAMLGGLDALESGSIALGDPDQPTIGELAIGTALDYFDFRFDFERWRETRPALELWYRKLSARASMTHTLLKPVDQGRGTFVEYRTRRI